MLVFATVLPVPVLVLIVLAYRDPAPRFAARRSALVSADTTPADTLEGHEIQSVRLTASSGLAFDLLLKRPPRAWRDSVRAAGGRLPVVLLIGGHATGRDAVRLIPDTRGTVVAAMSYPYAGNHKPKGLEVVGLVPQIRDAVLDTPPAIQLAMDWLLAQPDVDSSRAEGVGVSLGAPFMVMAGAMDPRITRVWAIHGSAGSYEPLAHNLRRTIPFAPARAAVAGLAAALIQGPRLAPERWAPRIAPREFVMVNATDDEQMPRDLVDRLYGSARDPKSMVWVPGGHVRAKPEIVHPLVELVLARVLEDGRPVAGATDELQLQQRVADSADPAESTDRAYRGTGAGACCQDRR
jgi:dienelactone hydrolase